MRTNLTGGHYEVLAICEIHHHGANCCCGCGRLRRLCLYHLDPACVGCAGCLRAADQHERQSDQPGARQRDLGFRPGPRQQPAGPASRQQEFRLGGGAGDQWQRVRLACCNDEAGDADAMVALIPETMRGENASEKTAFFSDAKLPDRHQADHPQRRRQGRHARVHLCRLRSCRNRSRPFGSPHDRARDHAGCDRCRFACPGGP